MGAYSRFALAIALFGVPLAGPVSASWPNEPSVNLEIGSAADDQNRPTIVSDGAGGAIITWFDDRPGTSYDIYAQHVLASGGVDPAWSTNGTLLCNAPDYQSRPEIVSDGRGGAIVTWQDHRSGASYDIFAQHVLASGAVDPTWTANGTLLCDAASNQYFPMIVTDGAGGAIVTWQDNRSGASYDVYAQHVLASGVVDPGWTTNGTCLCNAANNQSSPMIVMDGAGGAIVTWFDYRSGTNQDIYAQHVLASGAVDAAWSANGALLCNASRDQESPTIVSDGAGGAIVTWFDFRSGTNYDIYAQRVLASGVVAAGWTPNGTLLCNAADGQFSPAIVPDGAGGAIVTWFDYRSGTNYDIYAQRVLASGVVDPAWTVNGTLLCGAADQQGSPTIDSDGAGGAIIAWGDRRNGTDYDIYAHHILASGVLDSSWTTNGTLVCDAASDQYYPAIVPDMTGGAIVTWYDTRSDGFSIFAQRVARFGYLGTPEPEIAGAQDVPNDQGGRVQLSWNASYLDANGDPNVSAYDILRSVPSSAVALARARGARVAPLGIGAPLPGEIVVTRSGAQSYYWEFLDSVGALHYLSGYSYPAPTIGDSSATTNPLTAFMVVARNAAHTRFWPSQPATGYSVDNIAPVAPAPFTGSYVAGATHLHWGPNSEPDLAGYRLYRGSSALFVPGPRNLVAALTDTGDVDPGPAGSYYKLSAVDRHDNESNFALLTPGETADAPRGPLPADLTLDRPSPNPARRSTTLSYTLPRTATVSLAIYDASGRRVRDLAAGEQSAGAHPVVWDLRDQAGRTVPSGLYFLRLVADGRELRSRLVTIR